MNTCVQFTSGENTNKWELISEKLRAMYESSIFVYTKANIVINF